MLSTGRCAPQDLRLSGIHLQSVGALPVGYCGKAVRHTTFQRAGGAGPTEPIYLSHRHTNVVAGCGTGLESLGLLYIGETEWVQGQTPVGPQTQLSKGSRCRLYSGQTGYGGPGTTQTIVVLIVASVKYSRLPIWSRISTSDLGPAAYIYKEIFKFNDNK